MCGRKTENVILQDKFSSYQPYLELNNEYQSYVPKHHKTVRDVVWEVYEVDDFDLKKSVALPDICADLMTFYTEEKAYSYFMGGSVSLQQMSELDFMKDVKTIFGVRLRTGMLGNLFRSEVKDVNNSQVAMRDALWNGKEIEERLEDAVDFSKRWEIVASYLEWRISVDYQTNVILNYVVKEIMRNQGCISIKELEDKTGYTGRYLRTIVKDCLGISIKQFCEVTKFQWMCNCYKTNAGKIALSELALQAGYYDQSHMNLCCKKLTGELPKQIVNMYV